ncbi:MAG: hypothetical protein EXS63_05290 [Candidatus Omnitrophica bacterium]|nr:hypothetical protein [Candidatus Omnitrophota bacterium]
MKTESPGVDSLKIKAANFLVIGNKRCGTSWLNRNLAEHPDIFMATHKGVHFFDHDFEKGLEFYEKYFEQASGEKMRGETEHSYFWSNEAPARIKKTLGDIPMILSLRQPAERAFSHFQILQKHNPEGYPGYPLNQDFEKSFEKALEEGHPIASWGFYGNQLKKSLNDFSISNFHFVLYEDIEVVPEQTIQKIYQFLGVDSHFVSSEFVRQRWTPSTNVPEGTGKVRSYLFYTSPAADICRRTLKKMGWKDLKVYRKFSPPPLSPELKKKLTACYEKDIRLLMDLTGLNLQSWLV